MSNTLGTAQLEVSIDTTKMEAGITQAKKTIRNLGGELGNSVADGSAKAQRSIDAYIKKLEFSAATVGKTASEIKLLELAQRGATAAQLKAAEAAFKTIDGYKLQQTEARKAADAARLASSIAVASQSAQINSAKLTGHQMQQLSFQLNDLFVQVASGQSAITALIQQGSQLNGTFGGFGGTLKAVGSLFSVARVAAGGLIAAISGIGYAAYQGSEQSRELAKALVLTGNAAGITEGQFNRMAQNIAQNTNTSIGSAREALLSLTGSGKFTGEALSETAKAAQLFSKVTGQSSEDVIKQFLGMTDGVAKWAETTNRSYHFLTAEQIEYIRKLEEQGNQQKAIEVLMQSFNTRLGEAAKNTSIWADAWNSVTKALSGAKDVLASMGRLATPEDKIAQLRGAIAAVGGSRNPRDQAKVLDWKIELDFQEALAKALQETAIAQAASNKEQAAREVWNRRVNANLSDQLRMQKELDAANKEADAAGISQKDRQPTLNNIRTRYSKGPDLSKSTINAFLEGIKREEEALKGSYSNREKILEAQRAASLIGDKEYFDEKRRLVEANAVAEEASLQKQISGLRSQKASGKDQIEISQQIADAEAKLAKVRADAATEVQVLGIQQASANDKVTKSYDEMTAAAQSYLNTLNKQYSRTLEGMGKGQKFRDKQNGLNQIDDRYETQRQELQRDKDAGLYVGREDVYDKKLQTINEFHAKAKVGYEKYYADLTILEGNWIAGASEGLANYIDNANNLFAQTNNLVTNSLNGMEDAFVEFAKTGKLSFKDLADSIIADLIRIQVRQMMAGAITGVMSMFTSGAGAAAGVVAHTGGIIGGDSLPVRSVPRYHTGGIAGDEVPAILQRGEGVFTKAQMRALAPVTEVKNSQPISVSVMVDAKGTKAEGNDANGKALGQVIGNATKAAIIQEMRPGGLLENVR